MALVIAAGTAAQFSVIFYDETGNPADPATVIFGYAVGDGTTYSWQYGQAQTPSIQRTGVGAYNITIDTSDQPGTWLYAWDGVSPGIGLNVHEEGSLQVLAPTLDVDSALPAPPDPTQWIPFPAGGTSGNVLVLRPGSPDWEDVGSAGAVTSVTAGDSTITVGGTATAPTVKVTANTFDAFGAAAAAQAAAESASVPVTEVGQPSGVAELDSGGAVPKGELGNAVTTFDGRKGDVTLAKSDVTGTGLTYSDVNADQAGAAAQRVAKSGDTMTGPLILSGDPTQALGAATKQYTDSLASGLTVKAPVAALGASNVALSGLQTIDGYTLLANDRVLLTGQTTGSQNGLWQAASGAWSRPSDFANGTVQKGDFVLVQHGTTYTGTGWVLNGTVTVDTTAETWSQFSSASTISAGSGLQLVGNTMSAVFGTSAGTVTQGNDSRVVGAEQTANKNQPNGYAGLDGSGNVPASELGNAGILSPTSVKTADYTASPGDLVVCDTSARSFTVTIPNAPADKTPIGVILVNTGVNSLDTAANTVTIAAQGADVFNVAGGPTHETLAYKGQVALLEYRHSGAIWYDSAASQVAAPLKGHGTWSPDVTIPTVTTTGTWGLGGTTITVASAAGISMGDLVNQSSFPANTYVAAVAGTTVTASQAATGAGSGTPITFVAPPTWTSDDQWAIAPDESLVPDPSGVLGAQPGWQSGFMGPGGIVYGSDEQTLHVPTLLNNVLHGTGAPSNSLGNNGDAYQDTSGPTWYTAKTNGAWPSGISLVGPQGTPGVNGFSFNRRPITASGGGTTVTANVSDEIVFDTTAGAGTVRLPDAPISGAQVAAGIVVLGAGNFVTYQCQGSDTLDTPGGATSATVQILGQIDILEYDSSSGVWSRVANYLRVDQLDLRYLPTGSEVAITQTGLTNITPPAGTYVFRLIPGGGGGMGGCTTSSTSLGQGGSSGGVPGWPTESRPETLDGSTVVAVTVGTAGQGGAGGAAGGATGPNATGGGDSTVAITGGRSYRAIGGTRGNRPGATSTTGATGVTGPYGTSSGVGGSGAAAGGNAGSSIGMPYGMPGPGGSSGGGVGAGTGGGAGTPGTTANGPGTAGVAGASLTADGVDAADASDFGAGGAAGGPGVNNTGKGGKGGNGGQGVVYMTRVS